MSRGFLVCNYNSLLPLFRLLDCLDFVPMTPFCLVSVPFRHLPITVQRLPCFLAGQCVLDTSHPSQPWAILLCRVCSFQWWRSFFGCQEGESVPLVYPCSQALLWVIFTPSLSLSLSVSLLLSLAYFSPFFTSSLPPCLQESPVHAL